MMCKRDFRSLPALNGHMRSHSGVRSGCVSKVRAPPQPIPAAPVALCGTAGVEAFSLQSDDPSLPPSVSMVMPVSVPVHSKGRAHKKGSGAFAASRKTALYQSLLREDASTGDGVGARHYTPPPMLCPVRAAPGLYCSLAGRRLRRVQTIQLHNTPGRLEQANNAAKTRR